MFQGKGPLWRKLLVPLPSDTAVWRVVSLLASYVGTWVGSKASVMGTGCVTFSVAGVVVSWTGCAPLAWRLSVSVV